MLFLHRIVLTTNISGTSTHTNYFDHVVKERETFASAEPANYTDSKSVVNSLSVFFSSAPPIPSRTGKGAVHYTAPILPVKLCSGPFIPPSLSPHPPTLRLNPETEPRIITLFAPASSFYFFKPFLRGHRRIHIEISSSTPIAPRIYRSYTLPGAG